MGEAEWGGHPLCWWLGLYFCFVCCLDEASCTGCYWWLGDARSCIQVVSFVWVLTVWYSLGWVLWWSRVLESLLPLQRLRAWSQVLRGSLYSFPLGRCSCPLSAAVLHALLCLKVCSWCICGERCSPRPSAPPPSCSIRLSFFHFLRTSFLELSCRCILMLLTPVYLYVFPRNKGILIGEHSTVQISSLYPWNMLSNLKILFRSY